MTVCRFGWCWHMFCLTLLQIFLPSVAPTGFHIWTLLLSFAGNPRIFKHFVFTFMHHRCELGWHAPFVAKGFAGGNEGSRSADRWCGRNDESSPGRRVHAVRNGAFYGTRCARCWWLSTGVLQLYFQMYCRQLVFLLNSNQTENASFGIGTFG